MESNKQGLAQRVRQQIIKKVAPKKSKQPRQKTLRMMQQLCELQAKSQESDDNPEPEIKSSTKPTEEVPIVLSEQPD